MAWTDKIPKLTSQTNSDGMGQAVEEMVQQALIRRRSHERRWYDNNFFDDGYHFRVISRKTGRVVDHVDRQSGYVERAIPRASRQIRGVSNLLFASEPYPVVYPERVTMSDYMNALGQFDQQRYQQDLEKAKNIARKQGTWLANEWQDEQELFTKLIDMILLAAKNSISYLQIYSDTSKQEIITEVFDAFDLILFGDKRELDMVPFITKTKSMDLQEVKTSPLFEPGKVAKLTPDNKYATSEIKDAYMRSRFGAKNSQDGRGSSVIVKETFIKEYLSDANWQQAIKLAGDSGALEGKSKGDLIMRQIFSASGVTLADAYIDYEQYPFAEFRFEPGPLYQVPYIERFIPQNKSVDIIMTRLEKWVNTQVVGIYQKRKGENMQISNIPGGQVVEYEQTPLTQMNGSSVGQTPFSVIEMLDKYIEEQGASTAALNQIPNGVKSGVAIESIKSTEYANLKIPTLMLKKTMKKTAELMLERGDKDFLEPVEVSDTQDGETQYFDVIGRRGLSLHKKLGKPLPSEVVPLNRESKLRIEIEAGLGLTMEGKKQSAQQIIDYCIKLYQLGFLGAEAMSMIVKRFVETLGYGSTEELMEAIENGITQGQMSDQQVQQMQIALLKTLQDAGVVGPEMDSKLVESTKVGALTALKDAGMIKQGQDGNPMAETMQKVLDDMTKIYQYAPADIRKQIEERLGMQPSTQEDIAPVQADTASKIHGMVNASAQTNLAAKQQDTQAQQATKDLALKAATTQQDLAIKKEVAKNHGSSNNTAAK